MVANQQFLVMCCTAEHRKIKGFRGVSFYIMQLWNSKRKVILVKIDREKLDNAMAEKGLFVRDICRRTGISESTLKRISSGAVSVDNMTVGKIALVQIADIVEGDGAD